MEFEVRTFVGLRHSVVQMSVISEKTAFVAVYSWTSKGPIGLLCIRPYHTFCFGVAFVLATSV